MDEARKVKNKLVARIRSPSFFFWEDVEKDGRGPSMGAQVRAGMLHMRNLHPPDIRIRPHVMGRLGGDQRRRRQHQERLDW